MTNYFILAANVVLSIFVFSIYVYAKKQRDKELKKFTYTGKDNRIVCAANSLSDGYLIIGARHCDGLMHETRTRLKIDDGDFACSEQGFIDRYGTFHTRREAWVIACKANQIIRLVGGQCPADFGVEGVKLWSENLY